MEQASAKDVGANTARVRAKSGFPTSRALFLVVCAMITTLVALAGCGDQSDGREPGRRVVVEQSGSIEPGDARDPDYGDKSYDSYSFEANTYDRVRVEVAAEGFTPLLLLVETSTGAQLWEWQQEYSDEDALLYTIAGPGTYEARVYALEGETGSYKVSVILND